MKKVLFMITAISAVTLAAFTGCGKSNENVDDMQVSATEATQETTETSPENVPAENDESEPDKCEQNKPRRRRPNVEIFIITFGDSFDYRDIFIPRPPVKPVEPVEPDKPQEPEEGEENG